MIVHLEPYRTLEASTASARGIAEDTRQRTGRTKTHLAGELCLQGCLGYGLATCMATSLQPSCVLLRNSMNRAGCGFHSFKSQLRPEQWAAIPQNPENPVLLQTLDRKPLYKLSKNTRS